MTEWCVNVGLSIILLAIIIVQYVTRQGGAADDAEHKDQGRPRKVAKLENVAFVPEQQAVCGSTTVCISVPVADTHIRQGDKMVMDA